jgi:hypothetical protein
MISFLLLPGNLFFSNEKKSEKELATTSSVLLPLVLADLDNDKFTIV